MTKKSNRISRKRMDKVQKMEKGGTGMVNREWFSLASLGAL